jgi:iron-sulfur cluster repair protein YtfE (RIC family)
MPDNGTTDIRVQLATLKQEVENVNSIHGRIDTAIDKLTDVSTSIKSMLAVHEEKIQRQEQVDEVIFNKLRERQQDIDKVFKDLQREMDQVEKRLLIEIKSLRNDIGDRVGVLEKYRWIIIGGFIALGWVVSKNFMPFIKYMNGF